LSKFPCYLITGSDKERVGVVGEGGVAKKEKRDVATDRKSMKSKRMVSESGRRMLEKEYLRP